MPSQPLTKEQIVAAIAGYMHGFRSIFVASLLAEQHYLADDCPFDYSKEYRCLFERDRTMIAQVLASYDKLKKLPVTMITRDFLWHYLYTNAAKWNECRDSTIQTVQLVGPVNFRQLMTDCGEDVWSIRLNDLALAKKNVELTYQKGLEGLQAQYEGRVDDWQTVWSMSPQSGVGMSDTSVPRTIDEKATFEYAISKWKLEQDHLSSLKGLAESIGFHRVLEKLTSNYPDVGNDAHTIQTESFVGSETQAA